MTLSANIFGLFGKKILITGASSGIGRGIAIACSKAGASLLITGRNEDRLIATIASLEGCGHNYFICDLTNKQDIVRLVDAVPRLDGVVHCAGIGQRILSRHLTDDDVDSVMSTNFVGPVILQSRLLHEKRIKKGGSIVFIASMAAWSPSIGNSIYSASKGAIISYANCLSLEVAPQKIRVNSICPAMVWTNMIESQNQVSESFHEDENKYPLKRYGSPEDIANLAMFLLSDASEWMTGSSIKISGGAFNP